MKLFHSLAAAVLLTAAASTASAQQVRYAAGVRAGAPAGVTAKAFVTDNIAVEVIGGMRNNADFRTVNVSGGLFFYLEDHGFVSPLLQKITFYAGAGIGRSYFKYSEEFLANREVLTGTDAENQVVTRRANYADMSLNYKAYIGAQYLLPNAPLEITVDAGPSILPGKVVNPLGGHAAVSVRYIIKRQGGSVH